MEGSAGFLTHPKLGFWSRPRHRYNPSLTSNVNRRLLSTSPLNSDQFSPSPPISHIHCNRFRIRRTSRFSGTVTLGYVFDCIPMPYNLIYNLLRVLDALTLFFLQFLDEILKLVFLRYLSFTYNGELPPTLSRLQKLQFLIVKRDPICIYVGTPFLPDEIWNMKELRHLIISETDLPQLLSPTEPSSILLENLQTLSNVNATSCTQEVLEHMPNLKKLVMWVEAPGKVGLYLHKLDQLEVFKLTVLDPIPGKGIEFQPQLFIPDTVRKLNLSGCGLPWEQMEVIVKLPNLEVLKLKEFAFHGDEWCLTSAFPKLKFLLIEYLKLKKWEADSCYFPQLEQLIFRHCYDLKEFPEGVDFYWWENLRQIELVDCSSEAVKWRDDIIEAAEEYGYEPPQVRIYSSCE